MSHNVFLVTFDTTQMSRERLVDAIDRIPEIVNWYAFLPAAVYLVSELSTSDLSRVIRSRLPGLRHILVRLEKDQRQGWLPKSAWQFINNPRPAEKVDTAAE
jgi:hypothetical protein